MQRRTQTIPIAMPSRGVDLSKPSTFISPRYTPYARNTRYDYSYIGPRTGTSQLGVGSGTAMPFTGEVVSAVQTFYKLNGNQVLLTVTDKDFYRYTETTDIWEALDISGLTNDPLQGGVAFPVSTAHCAHNKSGGHTSGYYFVVSNGVDPVFMWDGSANPEELIGGTGYNSVITTHTAKQIFSFKDSLFLLAPEIDGILDPNVLYWSNTGDIAEWDHTSTNSGFLGFYDTPGFLQWAGQIGDYYALYKSDSITLLSHTGGTDLFRYDTVVRGGGLLAPGMLAVLDNEHILINKNNVYRWDGVSKPVPIGNKIIKDLLDNINWDAIDASRVMIDRATTQVKFYIASGSSDYANRGYIYDYEEDWWSIDELQHNVTATGSWSSFHADYWGGLPRTDAYKWGGSAFTNVLWSDLTPYEAQTFPVLADDNGYIFQQSLSVKNDNGVAIDQIHETMDFVPDNKNYQGRHVRYLGVEIEAKGDGVTLSYSSNEGSPWTTISTETLTSDWARYKLDFSTTARKLRFRLRNNTLGENFYCRWIGVKVISRGAGG